MLTAKNISYEYDNNPVLTDVSISIYKSEKIALIGSNGAGKSTLLKILAGQISPNHGKVSSPRGVNIGYMPQEIDHYGNIICIDFLREITGVSKAINELEIATEEFSKSASDESQGKYQDAFDKVESLQAYTLEERVAKVLPRVGLDNSILNVNIHALSGGQKTKLALAAVLLSKFDVFLLDEPTNNMDIRGLNILTDFIKKSDSAFLIVSHDRWFIKKVSRKIAELTQGGQIKIYSLGYDEYVESKRKEIESAKQKYQNYANERKRLESSAREKAISASSASSNARVSDNDKIGSNARKEKAANAHAKAASSIAKRLEQLKAPEAPKKEINLNFRFADVSGKLPSLAVSVDNAEINFGNISLGPFTISVNTGQKVVVIGPNGSGKSSLMKLIAGMLKPISGKVVVYDGIRIGYINQDFTFSWPDKSVFHNIMANSKLSPSETYGLLANFNIKKDKADSIPSKLSPGQRVRAKLASMVAQGANLLLLDEPTNHLDIQASNELQNALINFEGTLIVVTHDRELIDSLVDKKIIVVDNGKIFQNPKESDYYSQSDIN